MGGKHGEAFELGRARMFARVFSRATIEGTDPIPRSSALEPFHGHFELVAVERPLSDPVAIRERRVDDAVSRAPVEDELAFEEVGERFVERVDAGMLDASLECRGGE